jgi:hypothetical protein
MSTDTSGHPHFTRRVNSIPSTALPDEVIPSHRAGNTIA